SLRYQAKSPCDSDGYHYKVKIIRWGWGGWGDGETNSLLAAALLNRLITLEKADFADALSHTKPSLLR
ncbi:MAG: hypothetical protein WA959_06920, partial [Rivularia sp. (in: cyanobacteria)]